MQDKFKGLSGLEIYSDVPLYQPKEQIEDNPHHLPPIQNAGNQH